MTLRPAGTLKLWRRPVLLGLVFVLAGTLHFLPPAYYLRIIPPFLPHGLLQCCCGCGSHSKEP